MKCNQSGCQNDAFYRFTWPGRDEAGICTEHVHKLRQTADALGLHLQVQPIDRSYWKPVIDAAKEVK